MSARTSVLSASGLARRAMSAFRGGLILLGVVVLVATTAVSAWPRFSNSLLTDDLQYRVENATAVNRDLITRVDAGTGIPGSVEDLDAAYSAMPAALAAVRRGAKEPLRAVTRAGDYSARTEEAALQPAAGALSNSRYQLQFEAYARLRDVAELAAGAWPARVPARPADPAQLQVVLSTTAAELLGWKVGQSRTVSTVQGSTAAVTLVGTVHPRDARAEFWNLDPVRDRGGFADAGDVGKTFSGIAWIDPASWSRLTSLATMTTTTGWLPMASSAFEVQDLPAVQAALGNFLATAPAASIGGQPTVLRFSTSLGTTLDDFLVRAQPANTLFAILAAGPLGVALAVLVLGVRLVLGRRRESLALMAARGGSAGRLRAGLALEGAIVSFPAAALGLVAAVLLTPAGGSILPSVGLAALCAVAPPVVLAVAAGALGPRDDLGGEREARRRWGWVVEVLVIGLAVVGVVALFQRGLTPTDAGLGVDPLLAVTPILVALAACLIVLRVYAYPLALIARSLRRRTGAVAYLGAVSALRSRAGGLWPVFAIVVGVSITVFSVSILSTERAGIAEGARATVGADLSVTAATTLTDEQVAAVARVPGVANTAVVEWAGGVRILAGSISGTPSVYLVDPAQLAKVQQGIPESARVSTALTSGLAGRTGAVIGGWNTQIPVTSAILYSSGTVHLAVTQFDYAPGVYIWDEQWAIIDKTTLPAASGVSGTPATVLVSLAPGADASAVHRQLQKIGGDGAIVGDAVEEQETLRQTPLVGGLELVAMLAIALAAMMCIGALLLTLVMNTAARTRLVATLRTIGFTARQSAGLLAWELGPILVVGLLAGIIVGVALPAIVLAPIDLSGFTGGPVKPAVVIDPVLVALAAAGFAVVTVLATLIALTGARRRSPATVLRAGGTE
ncbi:ABC transporter permease [Leifsonia sp. NPDC058292]|uniref:ABC transporter permease n=1 Tax=Leifsonia sp. NPDC058292 TaxID=3346428 RepID=UPI0036DC0CDD